MTVPTGARIRMCESIAKLAKARSTKIAKDAVGETSSSSSSVDTGDFDSYRGTVSSPTQTDQGQASRAMSAQPLGQDSAVSRLVRARRPKIAQDADWDESKHKRASNGQFGSGGGGSAPKSASAKKAANNDRSGPESGQPAKSDASNPDHKWGSWKEFNDDYTKALQKRNSAQRDHDKATRMGQESSKTAARLQKAEAFAKAHQDHPNRPAASASTANFIRPR